MAHSTRLIFTVLCLSIFFGALFTSIFELWRNAGSATAALLWVKRAAINVGESIKYFFTNLDNELRESHAAQAEQPVSS